MRSAFVSGVELPTPASSTSPDLGHLLRLLKSKDAALVRSLRNIAILNIGAIVLLLSAMQLILDDSALAYFKPYAALASAAFFNGGMLTAIVFGMRLSGVVLELAGPQVAFKFSIPVLITLLFGIGAFAMGTALAYAGAMQFAATAF